MQYNILYTCSDLYSPFAGVSICSLLENNKQAKDIRIYWICDKVSSINIDRMEKLVSQYNSYTRKRSLVVVDAATYVKKMKDIGLNEYRNSYAPSLRLFFSEYIEEDIKRLLYLDSDTIVTDSLENLFNIEISEYVAAAVQDSLGFRYKQLMGFGIREPYFNAGVVLFNVEKWKREQYSGKLFNLMNKPQNRFPNSDQDFLNILLKGKIEIIHPKYNLQPVHEIYDINDYYSVYSREGYYTSEIIKEAILHPVVHHTYRFLGLFPWHNTDLHPDKEIFEKYKKLTPWCEENYGTVVGLYYAIERVLYRLLPKKTFLGVFERIQYKIFCIKMKLCKKCSIRRK